MTATHIYINPQGVPCAPTIRIPSEKSLGDSLVEQQDYANTMNDARKSSIPIREEDRGLFPALKGIKTDFFYEVEPYEFEVDNCMEPDIEGGVCHHCKNGCTRQTAKIPSKELYSIKPLDWRIEEDRITTGTIIGFYSIEEIEDGQFYLSFDRTGYSEVVKGVGQYKSISETKSQAQTHFESKLKKMLNREI